MIAKILTQIEDEFKRRGTPMYDGVSLDRRYVIDTSAAGKVWLVNSDGLPELYLEVYMSGEPDVVVARALDPSDKKTSRRFYGTTAVMPVAQIVEYVNGLAQRRVHQWEINEAYRAGRQAVIAEAREYALAHMDTATATFDVLEVTLPDGFTARIEFYLQDLAPMYKASITFLSPKAQGLDAVLDRVRTMAACGGLQ
jgi:hypothetical protein